ncbi:hypothetical protein GCM10010401_02410 [Rarobacter faecitabidus]|uniref:hypothetical protein n=1 Tax=Rarobacter faecitabidus TaxID=13243 RepID=UPI001476E693|nr:hypothetical protein [Rarobacter faecitabidus]
MRTDGRPARARQRPCRRWPDSTTLASSTLRDLPGAELSPLTSLVDEVRVDDVRKDELRDDDVRKDALRVDARRVPAVRGACPPARLRPLPLEGRGDFALRPLDTEGAPDPELAVVAPRGLVTRPVSSPRPWARLEPRPRAVRSAVTSVVRVPSPLGWIPARVPGLRGAVEPGFALRAELVASLPEARD